MNHSSSEKSLSKNETPTFLLPRSYHFTKWIAYCEGLEEIPEDWYPGNVKAPTEDRDQKLEDLAIHYTSLKENSNETICSSGEDSIIRDGLLASIASL